MRPVKIALSIVVLLTCVTAATEARDRRTFYPDRESFLAAVGASITDGYTAYGAPPDSSIRLSNAEMSAVLGETQYTSTSLTDINDVGHVYTYGDGTNYCSGCNGNFKLSFGDTSLSRGGAVFAVGVDILFHTSRRIRFDPNEISLEGTVLVEFRNGETLAVSIPADLGFFGPEVYFLGLSDRRGITSLTFGIEPIPLRHFWVIDNLTIADKPDGND